MKNSVVDQYNHFIDNEYNAIRETLNELHQLQIRKNTIFNIIRNNRTYLIMIGFPYAKLETIQHEDDLNPINVGYEFDDDVKSLMLKTNIAQYVYMCCVKIPTLRKKVRYHEYLLQITFKSFMDIYQTLNTEIANKIIRGETYQIPNSGGYLEIKRFPRVFFNKAVNWGETNKARKINPNSGIIYHIDDEYVGAKFVKANCKFPNYKIYRFKFTHFINGSNRKIEELYPKLNTEEKILASDRIGNFQKMMAMTKINGMKYYEQIMK